MDGQQSAAEVHPNQTPKMKRKKALNKTTELKYLTLMKIFLWSF